MVQLYTRVSRSLALPISTMPRFIIQLADKLDSSIGVMPATFTRNSTATYIEDGLVKTAEIDVPRFQNGRYLCEPTATNLIKNSQNLSLWSNSWSGGVTLTSGLDTIAGLPAFRLSQIDSIEDAIYGGDTSFLSLTAGTKYYTSLFIKNLNSVRCSVAFWDTAKLTMSILAIAWTGGVPSTYSNPTTITEITYTKLVGTDEYLVSFAYTVPAGSSTHRFLLFPEVSIVSTNSIIVTGVQLATTLTSYIPTTTTPVTRAADVLHYAVGDVITQGQGSLYCELWDCNYTGLVRRILYLSDGTSSNRLYYYLKDTGATLTVIGVTDGITVINIGAGTALSTLNKLLLSYENDSIKTYLNGILVNTETSGIIPTNFTTLSIGCSHDNILQLSSEVGNVKYFKEVLTEAQAIKLTTL